MNLLKFYFYWSTKVASNLRLITTYQIIDNVYRDLDENGINPGQGWWMHEFFNEKCKFIGEGHLSYIEFPNEDMMLMFMLKFGAK